MEEATLFWDCAGVGHPKGSKTGRQAPAVERGKISKAMCYLFNGKVGKMGLGVWLESAISVLTVVSAMGLFLRKFIFKSHKVTTCFTDEFFELVGCLPFLTHFIFTLKVRVPLIHKLIPLVPYRLISYVALHLGWLVGTHTVHLHLV